MGKFGKFFTSMFSEWGSRLSGPLSVPFAILALWVSGPAQRILYGSLAVILGFVSAYRIWSREYDRAEMEVAKNIEPIFGSRILEAFTGCAYQVFQGQEIQSLDDCLVALHIELWNTVNMPTVTPSDCQLTVHVNGQSYTGVRNFPSEPPIARMEIEGNFSWDSRRGFVINKGTLRACNYQLALKEWVGFYVVGMENNISEADVDLTFTSLSGHTNTVVLGKTRFSRRAHGKVDSA